MEKKRANEDKRRSFIGAMIRYGYTEYVDLYMKLLAAEIEYSDKLGDSAEYCDSNGYDSRKQLIGEVYCMRNHLRSVIG